MFISVFSVKPYLRAKTIDREWVYLADDQTDLCADCTLTCQITWGIVLRLPEYSGAVSIDPTFKPLHIPPS